MDYFFSLKDSHGFTHSIDNCIIVYYVHDVGMNGIRKMIDSLHDLRDKYPACNYWERLGINASRKYSFYQNVIHLDDGITVFVGHYVDWDADKKERTVFPLMQLKINPNKHAQKPVFQDFMALVNKTCYDGVLKSYDYAVDVPYPLNDVQVFGSNKEKGLYKGTRYYGQRGKNGFCRIYDKAKEQGLENPLTRIEHVVSRTKTTKKRSFEKVYVKSGNRKEEKISATDKVILDLCTLCQANGLDFEDILNGLDRRKRKTIYGYLTDGGYEQIEFDSAIHDKLLNYYMDFFAVKEPAEEITTDEEGFLQVSDDLELPFD